MALEISIEDVKEEVEQHDHFTTDDESLEMMPSSPKLPNCRVQRKEKCVTGEVETVKSITKREHLKVLKRKPERKQQKNNTVCEKCPERKRLVGSQRITRTTHGEKYDEPLHRTEETATAQRATKQKRDKRVELQRIAKIKRMANETPEKREKRLERERLARKRRIDNETAERKEERLAKKRAARNRRIAKETTEEKEKRLERERSTQRRAKAEEVAEKRERRLKLKSAARKRRLANEKEEHKEKRLENKKVARVKREKCRNAKKLNKVKETEEEREKRLEKRRLAWKKRQMTKEKRVKDPATREKLRFYQMMRRLTMTEEQREIKRKKDYLYWANLSKEKKEKRQQQHNIWLNGLTSDMKKRHFQNMAKATQKWQKKRFEKLKEDPERWKEYMRKVSEYQKKRIANESPEQKLRRRRKDTINHAKRRLKKKLVEQNVPLEDMEIQLRALGEKMWREYYPAGDVPFPDRKGPRKKVALLISEQSELKATEAVSSDDIDGSGGDGLLLSKHEKVPDTSHKEFIVIQPSRPETPIHSPPSSPPVFSEELEVTTTPTPDLVQCPECFHALENDVELRSHLFFCHPEKCWKCPKCKEVVLTPLELSHHFATVHSSTSSPKEDVTIEETGKDRSQWKFLCIKCPFRLLVKFRTREELFSHVRERHPSNNWPCGNCQLLKYSEKALTQHRQICRF